MTLKTQLLVGMELEKAAEAQAMLAEFEREETAGVSSLDTPDLQEGCLCMFGKGFG